MGSMVQQLRNVVVSRSVEKFGGAPDLQKVPILQHRDPVAESNRLVNVVRDHDQGLLEMAFESEKVALELVPSDRVECPEGFVKQDDARVSREGSRKSHALSLPTGQFDGVPRSIPRGVEIHHLQQFMHATRSFFKIPSEQAGHEADVLFDRPMWEQSAVLLHVPNVATEFYGIFAPDGFSMKVNLSGCRMVQPVQRAQQRGFSGSTFPDQDQRLTLRDVEGDVLKDSNVRLKLHRHVVDAQGRWVHDGAVHHTMVSIAGRLPSFILPIFS